MKCPFRENVAKRRYHGAEIEEMHCDEVECHEFADCYGEDCMAYDAAKNGCKMAEEACLFED